MEKGISKNQLIAQLTRSSHGDMTGYLPVGRAALAADPDFYAHLIAWNHQKGAIRDSKGALPLIATERRDDHLDNALAHLGMLSPRDLLKVVEFARKSKAGHWRTVKALVTRYLRAREDNWPWMERTILNFRSATKALYCVANVKAETLTAEVLFNGHRPAGSVFEILPTLKGLPAIDAAAAIESNRIPFLVVKDAMGKRLQEPDILLAVMDRMSGATITTNLKLLEKLGVQNHPALRAALKRGLERAAESSNFKAANVAATAGIAEKQADRMTVKGRWLVLADKSGSMAGAIQASRTVASSLARIAEDVKLVFFDTQPTVFNVTGKTLAEIEAMTRNVNAGGGTSIGVGLHYAFMQKWEIDGIAIITDGAEHSAPEFHRVYRSAIGFEPPVFIYDVDGEPNTLIRQCDQAGIQTQVFPLRGSRVDMSSIPNLVATMRVNPYALIDEIMATPLATTATVFKENHVSKTEEFHPELSLA